MKWFNNNKQIISNKFNDIFINVEPTLFPNTPKQDVFREHCMKFNLLNNLYLEPLYEQDVFKLISSLKSSTAGFDQITATLLTLRSLSLTSLLTPTCKLSLNEDMIPVSMKISNGIPLFKCKDPKMFNNYWPVSELRALFKVFEKIIYCRLLNYLNEFFFYSPISFVFENITRHTRL